MGKCSSVKKGNWCQESASPSQGLEEANGGEERPSKVMRHVEREAYKYLLSSYLEAWERDWEGMEDCPSSRTLAADRRRKVM